MTIPTAVETFVLGVVFGVSIAAPVGPIGVLCVQRTLARGWRAGVASGLGAASADAIYGAIVAVGATALSGLLVAHTPTLRLVGGLLLVGLGIQTARQAPASSAAGDVADTNLRRD